MYILYPLNKNGTKKKYYWSIAYLTVDVGPSECTRYKFYAVIGILVRSRKCIDVENSE